MKKIVIKPAKHMGEPYDTPGYEYDPVSDTFKDQATGKVFSKDSTPQTVTPVTSDLEDNHATTIDVSTYTEPVEITPTEDKDGMKKTTVTLSNIPRGDTYTTHISPDQSGIFCYVLGVVVEGGMAVCNNEDSPYFTDFTCETITSISGDYFQTSGGNHWYKLPE